MAKKSAIEKNKHRRELVKKFAGRRERLLAVANDESKSMEERFDARLKLAELPRNSSATRIRNRCEVTGRPRAYYRKLGMSPHRSARTGFARPDPRSREVELVEESIHDDQ